MAHKWEEWHDPAKSPGQRLMGPQERRCANCGFVQYEYREYLWMRLVSRKWRPLAGKCHA